MWPVAIALNYSVKNIQNDVRRIYIYNCNRTHWCGARSRLSQISVVTLWWRILSLSCWTVRSHLLSFLSSSLPPLPPPSHISFAFLPAPYLSSPLSLLPLPPAASYEHWTLSGMVESSRTTVPIHSEAASLTLQRQDTSRTGPP